MVDDAIDHSVRGSVWQMAGQLTGKTVSANVVVGYFIEHRPRPQMNIQPTLQFSQDWSKTRLSPMLRDTPILRGLVRTVKTDAGGESTILMKEYPGGPLVGVGANSEAGLRSKSIGLVIAEEIDTWPPSAEKGGDPFKLALVRMEGFPDAFWLMISTPLIKGASRIESQLGETDQQKWFVPCPRCGHDFIIMWEHIKWPGPKNSKHPAPAHEPENAYLECPNCRAELTDDDRIAMQYKGHWKATAPFKGIRGRWLNAFVTLKKQHRGFRNRLHEFVDGFLEAKKLGPRAIQVWVNTVKAETYELESEKPTPPEVLYARRESYTDLPERCLVLTCGADVQPDRIEAEIVGWGMGEESWGVEYRVFKGNVELWSVWDEFDQWIQSKFHHVNGFDLQSVSIGIDGRAKGKMVRSFVRTKCFGRPVYIIMGQGDMGSPWVIRGKHGRHANAKVSTAKETIYARTRIIERGPGYLHFPETYPLEWFQQLMSERAVTRWVNGIPHKGFELQPGARNEALDARVYAMAALEILRPNYKQIAENLKKRAVKAAEQTAGSMPEQKLTNSEAFTPLKPQVQANRRIIPRRAAGWMKF